MQRPTPHALAIVFQQGALVAVSKPAGLASQGGPGLRDDNLVDLARAHFGSASVAVVHRLDRNVSGLTLLALDAATARALSAQIREHDIGRRYLAVVRGKPPEGEFAIDAYLAKDSRSNLTRALSLQEFEALGADQRRAFKPSCTRARALERFVAPLGHCAVLEVELVTGRSHQIRAHLAYAGLPIVGDPKYGVAARGVHRPLLHAHRLAFQTPTGERIELSDAPPWSMHELRALQRVERRR